MRGTGAAAPRYAESGNAQATWPVSVGVESAESVHHRTIDDTLVASVTMSLHAADIWIWSLRVVFGTLLVVNARWTIRNWRREPEHRLHELSHALMAAGMLYMTLPRDMQLVPLWIIVAGFVVLAIAIVATGVRELRHERSAAIEACIGWTPPAAGSIGAAYMFLLPFPVGNAIAVPIALSFGLAAALRSGSALACAIDSDAITSRWMSARSVGCGNAGCTCGPSCGCGTRSTASRVVAWRLASYAAMNVAMAAMLIFMLQTGTTLHHHVS